MAGRTACYPRRHGLGSRPREKRLTFPLPTLGGGQLASGLIYPFFITLTFVIALRMIGWGRAAGVALPLVLFVAQKLATFTWFPPLGPPDFRAFYLALVGGAVGALLDFAHAGAMARRCALALWPIFVVAIIAGQRLSVARADDPLLLVTLCIVGAAVFLRLDQSRARDADAPLMLAASCGFASIVSLAWGITTTISPFAAVGTACLALAALSFGRLPRPFTLAAVLAGGRAATLAARLCHRRAGRNPRPSRDIQHPALTIKGPGRSVPAMATSLLIRRILLPAPTRCRVLENLVRLKECVGHASIF
ncbi:MAG: hypothetical protein ACYC1L_03175 [Alphaproteobacteria bacterium]